MNIVEFTQNIPLCPNCKKPTKRKYEATEVTGMYFKPIYNESGENINPDRNIRTEYYTCSECSKLYKICGNNIEGYVYL